MKLLSSFLSIFFRLFDELVKVALKYYFCFDIDLFAEIPGNQELIIMTYAGQLNLRFVK